MKEKKICPKCKSVMAMQHIGNVLTVLSSDIEIVFDRKFGIFGKRKKLKPYVCKKCGFVEFYV